MKVVFSIALSLFFLFLFSFFLVEQAGWLDEERVTAWILAVHEARWGAFWSGLVIAGLLTLDLLLPVPSSVVMTLSGALLGVHLGWMVSLTGAVGSALLGFGACRFWGRPAFNRLIGPIEEEWLRVFFERHGVWAILLSRSVPMLTEVISCLAGLSGLRFRLFFFLSLAGTWPLCVLYAWAGSRALRHAVGWAVALALVLPAAGFFVIRRVLPSKATVETHE